jgi:hypothetical protein
MIAETPSSLCTAEQPPSGASRWPLPAEQQRSVPRPVSSVSPFFDFLHGQTGLARNGIELHPVLGFACLSSSKRPPPPPPPAGGKCAASYPTVYIPPPPPDLDCGDIPYRNFRVRWDVANPDPHRFDGNRNGIGET